MAFETMGFTVDLAGMDPTQSGTILVWRAPSDTYGGGVTIQGAYATNHATTSGTVGYSLSLLKFSSAGTPAINGTIAASVGGTADHWTADVPKTFTVATGGDQFMDGGEWMGLVYLSTNAGTPTAGQLIVHYAMGR